VQDLGTVRRATVTGIAAAMAMTGMRRLTTELHLVEEEPPRAILRQTAPHLFRLITEDYHEAAIELAHWAYGGLGGAAFGLVPDTVRRHTLAGPAYGLLTWALFEAVIAPGLGLEQARRSRTVERFVLALDHVLYGTLVARAH
jgi:hypothetical protein